MNTYNDYSFNIETLFTKVFKTTLKGILNKNLKI